MMKKMYLTKGMAVMAFGLVVASCNKLDFSDFQGPTEEQIKENAEKALGVKIDANQTWVMTQNVTANVTVNLNLDENYTVVFYSDNPLYNENATTYGSLDVKEGASNSITMTMPSSLAKVYVATYDSKVRSVVNSFPVENGKITANIGGITNSNSRRAKESDYTDTYAKTLNNYLNPTAPNTWTTVKTISVDDMKGYTAITDNIIANETSNKNHTLSDLSYFYNPAAYPGNGDGKHYRVASGTTITEVFHINGTANIINDAVIYIEGTVHLNGNTLNGPTLVVAPGGKIIIDGDTGMSNAGRIIVMEGGSIVAADGVNPTYNINNGGISYNAGTIDFDGELNANGSDFYNNGTITVDVLRNTSGGKFTNFGHIEARTNTGASDAYNCEIINGCYMHFTENAGVGGITLLDNSRLDVDGQLLITGGANGSRANTLYNLSEINAGSLYCQNAVAEGPTGSGEYAIVKTSKFLVSHGGDFAATNNAYVDCNKDEFYNYQNVNYKKAYNANDYNYTAAAWIINNNIPNWTSENTSALIIPEGDCTGMGNNPGGGGGTIVTNYPIYSYAFEDTKVGDYDMNDVVIKAQETEDGKINLTLVAVGATLDLNIRLYPAGTLSGSEVAHYSGDFSVLEYEGNTEVHAMLGVNKGTMTNTGAGGVATPITIQIDKGNYDPAHLPLAIYSESQGEMRLAGSGQAPFGVIIPIDWKWPTERVNITSAYNYVNIEEGDDQSFGTYANKTGEALNWYNYPTGSVMIQ